MSSNPRMFARSFAGGEVAPDFFGRVDDVKYQTGLQVCRNFVVKPHGPVSNRAGLARVRAVKDSTKKTRIIPFIYAPSQSPIVELGAGYFRFHTFGETLLCPAASAWATGVAYAVGDLRTNGGTTYYCLEAHTSGATFAGDAAKWYAQPASGEYEVPNPYGEDDLAAIRLFQSNDVVTLLHENYPVAELCRFGPTTWVYRLVSFVSALAPPTSLTASATPATTSPGTPTLQSYVVTAVAGRDESQPSSTGANGQPTGGYAIDGVTNANPGVITVYDPTATVFALGDQVYVSGVAGMTQLNNNYYYVNSFTLLTSGFPDFTIEGFTMTLKDNVGTPIDTSAFGVYTGGGTVARTTSTAGIASCSNNLFDTGAYNTIAWAAVPGAERYYVYKKSNGLFGYIGQTQGLTFTDDNIAADISKTPPILDTTFNTPGYYPAAGGYFEQRRCFGGPVNNVAKFWATRSATESNLSYSIPGRDDDAISFTIAARERQQIRHIVPMANLILLTESGEWRVAPADGSVLTPSVSVRQQSAIGSAVAAPVVVNNNLIFAAARGGHLRELAYNYQVNGYLTGDISLRAPHLFDGYEILDIAYAKAPVPTVWSVSSSGDLIGLTYVPEQEVGAFHRHDTSGGVFEHIAVVPEGAEDVLYAVVKRGNTRSIERMASRADVALEDGFFVDAGVSQTFGSPVDEITGGIDHLLGSEVAILADGVVLPRQTFTGYPFALGVEATKVTIGLPIEADLQTLPIAVEAEAFAQGRPKNVSEVWLRVYKSSGIKVGPSFDKLVEYRPRTTEPMGSPPALRTREERIGLSPSWSQEGAVCIRHDDPTPLTVVSMTVGFAVGG